MPTNTISRKAFLNNTPAAANQIQTGTNGFSVSFDSFREVAEFFTEIGKTAVYNDNANTTTDRGFYLDEADGLARDAELDYAPGVYSVYFSGWILT